MFLSGSLRAGEAWTPLPKPQRGLSMKDLSFQFFVSSSIITFNYSRWHGETMQPVPTVWYCSNMLTRKEINITRSYYFPPTSALSSNQFTFYNPDFCYSFSLWFHSYAGWFPLAQRLSGCNGIRQLLPWEWITRTWVYKPFPEGVFSVWFERVGNEGHSIRR